MNAKNAKELALNAVDSELKKIYALIEKEAANGQLSLTLKEKPSDAARVFLKDAGYEVKIGVFPDNKPLDGKWILKWDK